MIMRVGARVDDVFKGAGKRGAVSLIRQTGMFGTDHDGYRLCA